MNVEDLHKKIDDGLIRYYKITGIKINENDKKNILAELGEDPDDFAQKLTIFGMPVFIDNTLGKDQIIFILPSTEESPLP